MPGGSFIEAQMAAEYKYNEFLTTSEYRSGGNWIMRAGFPKTALVLKSMRDWPETKYRRRPADLFASGTPRTTKTEYKTSTASSRSSNSDRRDGYPSIDWVTADAFDALAPDVDSFVVMENNVRKNLREHAVNLSVVSAEYRKTCDTFSSLARQFASGGRETAAEFNKLVRKHRHRRIRNYSGEDEFDAATKVAANKWLAYQYGVRPVVGDMENGLKALKKGLLDQPLYITGVESRKGSRSDSRKGSISFAGPGNIVDLEFDMHLRRRVRWRARFATNPLHSALVRHGLANPFTVAYELIPFSFVLDWFINVGDVLASFDNMLMFESLQVIRSTSTTRRMSFSYPDKNWYSSDGLNLLTSGNGHHLHKSVVRSGVLGSPLISPLVYKPSISLTRVVSALALLRQLKR